MSEDINYKRVEAAMKYIAERHTQQPSIGEIANHIHLSEFHFQRIFKEWAGVTPKKFLQYITLKSLKEEIKQSQSIATLTDQAGLSSPSRVYDLFVNIEAVTPQEYKTRGKGIEINYGIHQSPFGECFIASTQRGVCAIEFIDENQDEVVIQFRNKWLNANIIQNQQVTKEIVEAIFNHKNQQPNILLFGSPFQIKVWEALLKIPFGQLTTYGKISGVIGNPLASRAVGTAIGANNLAYLIPCHRVIRSLGGLGGYKWGEARKLAIIGWEKSHLLDS